MSPLEKDPVTGEYVYVSYENAKRRPGRPKSKNEILAWLGGAEQSDNSLPEEIELSEDAPVELLFVASFTNFLNGHEMDYNVRVKLRSMRIDADRISADRTTYAAQIQSVRDAIYAEYSDQITSMGNYILGDTTSGMGSVMAAMTGESDKRGKRRW